MKTIRILLKRYHDAHQACFLGLIRSIYHSADLKDFDALAICLTHFQHELSRIIHNQIGAQSGDWVKDNFIDLMHVETFACDHLGFAVGLMATCLKRDVARWGEPKYEPCFVRVHRQQDSSFSCDICFADSTGTFEERLVRKPILELNGLLESVEISDSNRLEEVDYLYSFVLS